jgi:GDPmannose 4,6-dehydratase
VRDFVEAAFGHAGLDWRKHVEIDPRYLRPTEVDFLMGDGSKARKALGWKPKVTFAGLVSMMVDSDIELAKQEATLLNAGHLVTTRSGSGF